MSELPPIKFEFELPDFDPEKKRKKDKESLVPRVPKNLTEAIKQIEDQAEKKKAEKTEQQAKVKPLPQSVPSQESRPKNKEADKAEPEEPQQTKTTKIKTETIPETKTEDPVEQEATNQLRQFVQERHSAIDVAEETLQEDKAAQAFLEKVVEVIDSGQDISLEDLENIAVQTTAEHLETDTEESDEEPEDEETEYEPADDTVIVSLPPPPAPPPRPPSGLPPRPQTPPTPPTGPPPGGGPPLPPPPGGLQPLPPIGPNIGGNGPPQNPNLAINPNQNVPPNTTAQERRPHGHSHIPYVLGGALVGYIIGRRGGRKRAERKFTKYTHALEKRITPSIITKTEELVRAEVRTAPKVSIAEKAPQTAKVAERHVPKPSTRPESKPEQSTEKLEKQRSTSKETPENAALAMILKQAEKIPAKGSNVRRLFEQGLLSTPALKEIVAARNSPYSLEQVLKRYNLEQIKNAPKSSTPSRLDTPAPSSEHLHTRMHHPEDTPRNAAVPTAKEARQAITKEYKEARRAKIKPIEIFVAVSGIIFLVVGFLLLP